MGAAFAVLGYGNEGLDAAGLGHALYRRTAAPNPWPLHVRRHLDHEDRVRKAIAGDHVSELRLPIVAEDAKPFRVLRSVGIFARFHADAGETNEVRRPQFAAIEAMHPRPPGVGRIIRIEKFRNPRRAGILVVLVVPCGVAFDLSPKGLVTQMRQEIDHPAYAFLRRVGQVETARIGIARERGLRDRPRRLKLLHGACQRMPVGPTRHHESFALQQIDLGPDRGRDVIVVDRLPIDIGGDDEVLVRGRDRHSRSRRHGRVHHHRPHGIEWRSRPHFPAGKRSAIARAGRLLKNFDDGPIVLRPVNDRIGRDID